MKVYISVDIEGITGIAHWDEARKNHADHAEFRTRMTAEAAAACEGALAAGATEIWVKDAHGSGRNLLAEQLPGPVRLIRGWSGHPYAMLQELDESFDAVCLVGWHGPANHPANPLAHTLTGNFADLRLNDQWLSEYLLHAHVAALTQTPIVFISGDAGICSLAENANPAITAVVTHYGRGEMVVGYPPAEMRSRITTEIEAALRSDLASHTRPSAPTLSP
ncbi:MAG: M55 family metallopeptidase [Pseudomonadota bacterium]